MTLNPAQLEAIECPDPLIAVAAGPGSGKTQVIADRIGYRIDRGLAKPENIICLTFTNAGAYALGQRINQPLAYLGTLHGYCYRLLQRWGHLIGYRTGGVTLVSAEIAKDLLAETAAFMVWRGSDKALNERRDARAELIWLEYGQRLKRNNLVDYDTTLAHGLRIIQQSECAELYVDEAQDSAQIDWEIYNLFPAETKFIVGDPDQCLYAFRGAYPEGFVTFSRQPEVKLITLEQNYRSGIDICRAATSLIRHNLTRVDKAVISASGYADLITVQRYPDGNAERTAIVASVAKAATVCHENEIAVLLRTNALANEYRDAIKAAGVVVAGAKSQQMPPDWREALDVLNLMIDPRNDIMAERVIKRIRPSQLKSIKDHARSDAVWLSDAAGREGVFPVLAVMLPLNLLEVVAIVLRMGIGRESADLIEQRISLLPQRDPTLADLAHDLFNHDKWNPEESEGVQVATIHGAKGKEWLVVFLPAWNEGIVPTLRADTTDETIEEERRLAFVALTRAKSEVFISSAERRRDQWGKESRTEPSRFIGEMNLP